jgi:hypothetical protein
MTHASTKRNGWPKGASLSNYAEFTECPGLEAASVASEQEPGVFTCPPGNSLTKEKQTYDNLLKN